MTSLTPRQSLERRLTNDARNVAWASRLYVPDYRTLQAVISDCAIRMVEARDLDDHELILRAERGLRDAVALLRAP